MPSFSRSNPSPRYVALQQLYAQLHTEGEKTLGLPPERTFAGTSLLPNAARIKQLASATGARSILDYGSGKGDAYRANPVVIEGKPFAGTLSEYWGAQVRCYDPGYAPYSQLPQETFDGVVCTDVLEHCPESDLDWIIGEIFGFARKFVYLNVACFPARKSLPTGENAHITVRPPAWWCELVARHVAGRDDLRWRLVAVEMGPNGATFTEFTDARTREEGRSAARAANVAETTIEGRPARFLTPNDATRWRVDTLLTKEPSTIEWLRAMPAGTNLVDVGANVGMYTVYAALARQARVWAFEPESQNYAVLNMNIALNDLSRQVVAFCAALGDHAGVDRLYLAAHHAGASCHSLGAEVGFDLRPRPSPFVQGALALRLDDLVASGQIPVPHYVKIDVDGFEHKVVAGAMQTLRRPEVRGLCIEVNHNLEPHLDLVDELGGLGFRHDPAQVARAERKEGAFKGVAEYIFQR